MPRRRRDEAVSERANQILDKQAQRRREAAQRGAQTRRQRRQQEHAEAQAQRAPESPTQAPTTRRSRPCAHGDMLTVAIRGPLAEKMRELAERHGMSLSKLLQDCVLVFESEVFAGYQPGTRLKSRVLADQEPEA
ncbi:MAG: hypothetical protein KA002_01290 [Firmicutes bacterium]|nr:hypothetical protein [Bacillota bacterium]